MSETLQESVPGAMTSAAPSPVKELNAESVTGMAASFLKRIGHKGSLKPKRVSLEGEIYTVEVELSKFTATVKIDMVARQIKEYDVQPKGEESSSPLAPKTLISMIFVSAMVNVGLFFAFRIFGI